MPSNPEAVRVIRFDEYPSFLINDKKFGRGAGQVPKPNSILKRRQKAKLARKQNRKRK